LIFGAAECAPLGRNDDFDRLARRDPCPPVRRARAPTLLPDDVARPLREVDRRQVVVGPVEDVVGEHLVGGIVVALSSFDLDRVETAEVVGRRSMTGTGWGLALIAPLMPGWSSGPGVTPK